MDATVMDSVKTKMVNLRNEKDQAIDDCTQIEQKYKECQGSLHQVESDCDDLNRKIQNLESENVSLQENVSNANNKIEEHEEKEKNYEQSVNELNGRVQTLEKSEEELLASIKQLTDKLLASETLAADFERMSNKLRLDNEKLEKDVADSEEKFKNVQESLMSAVQELDNV